jgi:hypothetical protein
MFVRCVSVYSPTHIHEGKVHTHITVTYLHFIVRKQYLKVYNVYNTICYVTYRYHIRKTMYRFHKKR